jgi:hypothetical protein
MITVALTVKELEVIRARLNRLHCGWPPDLTKTVITNDIEMLFDHIGEQSKLLTRLVEFEPTEHCHILHEYKCVFCGAAKSDDGDDDIEHEKDCLITCANELLELDNAD